MIACVWILCVDLVCVDFVSVAPPFFALECTDVCVVVIFF